MSMRTFNLLFNDLNLLIENLTPTMQKAHQLEDMKAAIEHIDHSIQNQSISLSAALGLIYSITETVGVIIGDPDLPRHIHNGYEGLAEVAIELQIKIQNLRS